MAILGLFLVVIERGLRIAASAARRLPVAPRRRPRPRHRRPGVHHRGRQPQADPADRDHAAVHQLRRLVAARQRDHRRAAARPVRQGVEPPPPPRPPGRLARLDRRSRLSDRRAATARPPAAGSAARLRAARRVRPPCRGRAPLEPLGRTIGHVGLALTVAFAGLALGAGYWQVLRSAGPSTAPDNPAVIAAARNVVRGEIVDRDGKVLALEQDATRTASRTGVYLDRAFSTVIGYASPAASGRPASSAPTNAELTGVSNGDPIRDVLRKFQSDPYDPQTLTLSRLVGAPAGRGPGPGRRPRRRRHARSADRRDPRARLDADLRRVGDRQPGDPRTRASPPSATTRAKPLLTRATQGRYVPGSVFKIVTAIAGLGSGGSTADTTFPEPAQAEKDGLVVDGFRIREHAGVPAADARPRRRDRVSSNIWFALAGLRTGGDNLAEYAARMGFGAPIAVRPADRAVAGHERRRRRTGRLRRRHRARERRRTARPRRSSRRSRWRSSRRPSRTTAS